MTLACQTHSLVVRQELLWGVTTLKSHQEKMAAVDTASVLEGKKVTHALINTQAHGYMGTFMLIHRIV